MPDLVTIATFTFPNEHSVIKARLESEGIECFVKDEMTVQVHPFYSQAIGGIKLQVWRSDEEKAIAILEETGYLNKSPQRPGKFWVTLHNLTVKIPWLRRLRFELRVILIAAFILAILGMLIHTTTTPF